MLALGVIPTMAIRAVVHSQSHRRVVDDNTSVALEFEGRRPHVGNLDRVLVRERADCGLERQTSGLQGGGIANALAEPPTLRVHPAITAA